MNTVDLWNDLLSEQNIISREEIEYEIALDSDLLDKREDLLWQLFMTIDNDGVVSELEKLYIGVVEMIKGRGCEHER